MPVSDHCPAVAMMPSVDVRGIGSVYNRGGADVVIPPGVDYYRDMVAMLTGYGSQPGRSLADDMAAQWSIDSGGGSPGVRVGLTDDDRIYIETDGGPWSVVGSVGGVYGFGASSSVLVSGWHRIEASSGWSRAVIANEHMSVTRTGGGTWLLPSVPYRVQSAMLMVERVGSVGDADDRWATSCLETIDNDADLGAYGLRTIRWGVDESGHVWTAWSTDSGIADPVWTDAAYMRRLGYTGREVAVIEPSQASGFLRTLTAECPTVLVPHGDGYDLTPSAEDVSAGVELYSRQIATTVRHYRPLWTLTLDIPGPAYRCDRRSDHLRLVRDHIERMPRGSLASVVVGWPGEIRRALSRCSVVSPAVGPYSSRHTTEGYHDVGRLVCRRTLQDAAVTAVVWPGRVQRTMSYTVQLIEAEDSA